MLKTIKPLLVACLLALLLSACGSRQIQDSLTGATAQMLVSHSIDDLARHLPEADFLPHAGKSVFLTSHFLAESDLRDYADQRLAIELQRRFKMQMADSADDAELTLNVFYTALGTDFGTKGFHIPLGFMPGFNETAQINLISLEQFHGVAEMYYFIGQSGSERRGDVLQARTRTDAIGLPIITIPISSIDRRDQGGD
ncbi:MAG TPA: hypothetical protein VK036_05955 [Wenzhouxiangella sp.]|nr:hypothetical protein [Wenzhouxiangella sp.]